jgi:hypothetical protein
MGLDDFNETFPEFGGDGFICTFSEDEKNIITKTSTYEDNYKYSCTIAYSSEWVNKREKTLKLYGKLSLIILEKPFTALDSYASKTKFVIYNDDGSCLKDCLDKFLDEYTSHLQGLDILLRKKLPTHNEKYLITSFLDIAPKIQEACTNIMIARYAATN